MQRANNLFCLPSERAFIGCVVCGGGAALETCAATEEHFTDPQARHVFTLAHELFKAGKPINNITIMRTFSEWSLERLSPISEMCFYPIPSEAPHFFDIINDKLTLRRAQSAIEWAGAEILKTDKAKEFHAEFQTKIASIDTSAASDNVLGAVCDAIESKIDRMLRGEVVRGIQMKISPWDNNFGGIMPGQMYAVAGRPGTGKTALVEMLIQECLETGNAVSVFEKDMSPQKLIERMACRVTNVQFWAFARGLLTPSQLRDVKRGVEMLKECPFHLYNPNGLTAERFCQIARRDIRTKSVKAVFLDHIQALKVGKDMREGLTQASLAIRNNVTETNTPHIILAHINRNGAKGRPTPEDIKEFDQLYGDCDGMMILWTEQSRAEMASDEMMTTKFYTAKNRDGGISEDEILFDGGLMKFKEKAKPRA